MNRPARMQRRIHRPAVGSLRARVPRGARAWPAAALIGLLVTAGCYSHEERWGRDPADLRRTEPAKDEPTVTRARAQAATSAPAEEPGDLSPVAVLFINGDAITVEDILKWMRYDLEKEARTQPPDKYIQELVESAGREVRNRAEGQLLSQIALRRMTEEEVKRLDEMLDKRIREIINSEHGGRQSRYEAWLKERGLTLDDQRARLRREMLAYAHLQRNIGDKVSEPTRREIEQFYQQYLAELDARQRRQMQLIEVCPGPEDCFGKRRAEPLTRAQALARMISARQRIAAGDDFAAVARELSEGLNAERGGDWGWVGRDGLKARWQPAVEALYALEVGACSDIIETDEALFLVRCPAVDGQQPRSFADIQGDLIENYKQRQFDLYSRELVAELYRAAEVRPTNPARFLRAVVEAAPQPPASGRP